MKKFLLLSGLFLALLLIDFLHAQSPAPVIVQAVTPASGNITTPAPVAVAPPAGGKGTAELLQEMVSTNAATLKKQEAALENLDAIQKAAEEIKILTKRS